MEFLKGWGNNTSYEKTDFRKKAIKEGKDKEGHGIMLKGEIQQEHTTL